MASRLVTGPAGGSLMACLIALLVCWNTPAMADQTPADRPGTVYYVSPQGDDTGPGTSPREAFRSIARAVRGVAAGDTIRLMPGEYCEAVALSESGTPEAPITITRHGQGEVVWTMREPAGSRWEDNFALNLRDRSHVVVSGITFRDCIAWIFMWDTDHCTVRDCVFDGARIYNCLRISDSSYNRILDCDFRRALPYVPNEKGVPKQGADYIEIFHNSHHNLVQGCTFGEIPHVAVIVSPHKPGFSPSHNIIRNCVFTDPRWKCIGLHAAPHTLVENCVMRGNAAVFLQFESSKDIIRRNLFVQYRDSVGDDPAFRGTIRIASTKDSGADCDAHHNRIYNNVFADNERTITSYAARYPMTGNVFLNNIFWNNRQTIWLCQPDYTTASRNYFFSNVLCGTAPGQKVIGLASDTFTLAEAEQKMPDLYRANTEADPRFVDAEGGDYRLRPDSPCIDAATDLTHTAAAGSGAEVAVEDALYFCDGFGLIDGDMVVVGKNEPARVLAVDYDANVLALDRSIAWEKGDPVNLPYSGSGPDIGCYEAGREAP